MKITSIKAMQMPSGNAAKSRGSWSPVIVQINTDEGITGWGEAGLAYGKGWRAALGILQDFGEVVVGKNPMHIEEIWESIFRKTFWGMGGGTVVNAGISAIDIALWDIKGKALGVPVYELFGGKTNDHLRTYASQLQFGWGTEIKNGTLVEPEEYFAVTKQATEEGYDAIKVDPIYFSPRRKDGSVYTPGDGDWNIRGPLKAEVLRTVYDRVKAMREAGGEDLDIIIELHANTDTIAAVQIARVLEPLRIFYYEEPVHSLNTGSFRVLKEKTSIPIAAGERIYTRQGYRPFFESRSIDVIQPDLCLCGGLTEAKKIADMAWTYDASVQIHVCGSPISKAAALQLEAAIPNFLIHEHHQRALNPESRAACKYDWQPENGRYDVPDLPGIGQEPTEETLEKCEVFTISEYRPYMR